MRGASKKMLTQNLRKLEREGIVVRSDLSDTVLHIEYDLDAGAREAGSDVAFDLSKWASPHSARLSKRSQTVSKTSALERQKSDARTSWEYIVLERFSHEAFTSTDTIRGH